MENYPQHDSENHLDEIKITPVRCEQRFNVQIVQEDCTILVSAFSFPDNRNKLSLSVQRDESPEHCFFLDELRALSVAYRRIYCALKSEFPYACSSKGLGIYAYRASEEVCVANIKQDGEAAIHICLHRVDGAPDRARIFISRSSSFREVDFSLGELDALSVAHVQLLDRFDDILF